MRKETLSKSFFYRLILLFFILFACFTINNNIYASTTRPLAIMIGNSPEEVIHQNGLNKADIIYEANVEYPFTRLMAIFNNSDETIVGPVRSSRYYFSRLAVEWSAIFAHCGGQSLKNERIVNLDQMSYPSPYWRDKNIGGWINLFTNTQNIREKSRKMGFQEKVNLDNHLLNLRTLNLSGGDITKISIKYNQKYTISYEYKDDTNTYLRYINSKLHQDSKTLEPITVSNIIIQYVPVKKIPDDGEGRLEVEVIGEGIVKVFYGGNYFLSKWVKKSKDHSTVYYDRQGTVINLNQGNIWIHLVPEETKVWFK
ncbi:MAG TPA: hypothetical protein DCK79_05455 [Candidatus Atribacteria bacterium]|jgi:hypothetical protein|nr:MAG: Uncharacterized protein XD79_0200 [Atribacteria bacterium 34_128]HAJ32802.1 hypothetical protein [Candidatus Atribacteria bacterium]